MNRNTADKSINLKDNAMLKHRPELFYEWNFEKNDALGLDIYKVTKASTKEPWWNCPKCKSPYDMPVESRVLKKSNCPYCSGHRINHTNSLASLYPTVADEWHPTLNGELTPHDVSSQSNKNRWWLGECGHHWNIRVADRTNMKSGCPYCANFYVWIGFNDMWTTNPSLAKQLLNPEDGYKYTQSSGKRVDWKCLECRCISRGKLISNINKNGLSCLRCSDGVKFPEKFMYNLLSESGINFVYDTTQKWAGLKRYDFYLPDYNWIIETHGGEHYGKGFSNIKGAKTLEEEQENDKLKYNLAQENGIDNYIVIDCRHSTVEWIKSSILNSDLMKIINEDDIDFEEIGRLASSSFVKVACDLWNSGIRNAPSIAKKIKIAHPNVVDYLKRGAEIGWCDYCPKEVRILTSAMAGTESGKNTIQLSKDGIFIKEWKSSCEAAKHLGITNSNISAVCRGTRTVAGGYHWMYKKDYINLTEDEKRNIRILPNINSRKKKVYQLDSNLSILNEFNSVSEAVNITNVRKVSDVCLGNRKSAGGFRWMFKEDYNALFANQKETD